MARNVHIRSISESSVVRLGYLDSLRGLAALQVVVFHMVLVPTYKPTVPQTIKPLVMYGGSGVILFFVMSAFSLCMTLGRHHATGRTWTSYAFSRFFRIVPLFYLFLVLTFIRDVLVFGVWQSPRMVLLNASFLYNFFPGYEQGFVWASWTIGVEMLFYVLFPFFVPMMRDPRYTIVAFCSSLMSWIAFKSMTIPVISEEQVLKMFHHFSLFKYLPVFLLGMIAYRIHESTSVVCSSTRTGGLLVVCGLGLLSAVVSNNVSSGLLLDTQHVSGLGYALVLLGLATASNPLLDNKPLRFFGRISYSLYLWHAPVIYFLSPLYERIDALPLLSSLRFSMSIALTLIATVPVSYLTYRFVELSGIAIGRRAFTIWSSACVDSSWKSLRLAESPHQKES